VGYTTYLKLIPDLTENKETYATGMRDEVERCRYAIEAAHQGKQVALVCSGDPGVYGMAGLIFELLEHDQLDLDVEIVPGVTAASQAAARVGAPLMCDFLVLSLSDLLVPQEQIRKRLKAAVDGDFVTVLYNPKSKKRTQLFAEAIQLFSENGLQDAPAAVVTNAGREGETVQMTTIAKLPDAEVNMLSVVIFGNSQVQMLNGQMVARRGYEERGKL
jgi:precorrin-3B C17-methyltransferase